MSRRAFGNMGEAAASEYLRKRGWEIVARNVRYGQGEIDIVARKGELLAFVEVKRRSSTRYGQPVEAVSWAKRRHIALAAAMYVQEHGPQDAMMRFDIIEILGAQINHIENAFDATGLFD